MAHVSQKKKEIVAKLEQMLKQYPVVGVANLFGVPASQLQKIRAKLKQHLHIIMSKKTLMKIALERIEKEKPGVSKLVDYFEGMPCFVLTRDTPFKLAKLLAENKTAAPAKAGQIAPHDIVIEAGPTPFTPGPIIGELGALGIKTAVENGKIVIKSDTVVVKEGEEIKENVASLLTRLGIEPMEIGISLTAVYEAGEIFPSEVLEIDQEEYISSLSAAHAQALGLSLEIGYFTKENIEMLLSKAHSQALQLAVNSAILTEDTVELILTKANALSEALKAKIKIKEG
ncbi:50S ribosomal protein L10 [Candidatus Woesearchaeota archaeon]|nr:50S ribosomal protein L10 [Candidatus Woesearchaeota archaeon]RLE42126.1 MAG: 50S ribosomal protein L10 [Candidatus Woesearchaeota archaeon]